MLDGEMNHHTGPGPESRCAESYQQTVECVRCGGEECVTVMIDGPRLTVGICEGCQASDWTLAEENTYDTMARATQLAYEDGLADWDGGMI